MHRMMPENSSFFLSLALISRRKPARRLSSRLLLKLESQVPVQAPAPKSYTDPVASFYRIVCVALVAQAA